MVVIGHNDKQWKTLCVAQAYGDGPDLAGWKKRGRIHEIEVEAHALCGTCIGPYGGPDTTLEQ